MAELALPVRFYPTTARTLSLDPARTALMLVDCDGEGNRQVKERLIAPVLAVARTAGLRVFYFHEDAHGIGGPGDITRELHGARHDQELPDELFHPHWRSNPPTYLPAIAPQAGEPDFPKDSKDGFASTNADYYLRSYGVDTIIAVGFALPSCVYHTCMGARHRNYRVILLRDCTTPPGSGEFPDTQEPSNPEGGWMRFAFIRQFETSVGYTSTSEAFIAAARPGTV